MANFFIKFTKYSPSSDYASEIGENGNGVYKKCHTIFGFSKMTKPLSYYRLHKLFMSLKNRKLE